MYTNNPQVVSARVTKHVWMMVLVVMSTVLGDALVQLLKIVIAAEMSFIKADVSPLVHLIPIW